MCEKITEKQYAAFQKAFDHFNNELFDSDLPDVVMTLNRKKNAGGYFAPARFMVPGAEEAVHEIALNPDCFTENVTAQEILAILVHEQAHLWQREFGKRKSRGGYHNREWADKMEEIGLMPSSTGHEDGSRTGRRMSHYIIEDGPFQWACEDLLYCNDALLFTSILYPKPRRAETSRNKVAYLCHTCGQKAWAKPEATLVCGECREDMQAEE